MSGRCSGVLSILIIILLAIGSTEAGDRGPDGFFSEDAPIEITSESLSADSNQRIAIFEGKVVARQAETTLTAEWLQVTYDENGEVVKILARGDVRIKKGDRMVEAEEAEYLRREGKIILRGHPVAVSPNTRVEGTRMVYFIQNGRYTVENSRVILSSPDTE